MARNAALLRRLSRVLSRAGADAAGARSASAVATPSLSEGLQRRVAPDGAAGAGAQLAAQGALQVASPAAPAVRDGSHGGASADGAPPAAAAAALLGQARGTWRVPVSATQQVLAGGCAASALALAPALASAGLRTGRGLGSLRGLVASGNGPRPAHAMPAGVRGVKTQPTPNPQSLMFLPGHKVLEGGSRSFGGAGAASGSPLAERLFAIEGVASVFLGSDFVTVTKQEDAAWGPLKAAVADAISAHFASGAPAVHPDGSEDGNDEDQEEDEVVSMIKELLETRIRPAVNEDGGDIEFRSFDRDTGVVMVKMAGACEGCPSSTITLKSGIENMLMHYVPEVKSVVEDTSLDEYEEEGAKAFEQFESKLGDDK
mmetsp:Transcript_31526/g.94011  ORF Transcript_31526/g.94011 Transcript_31526/m.94011 type:complete len:373 (-) Transcript_31526:1244-2362(-)